MNKIFLFLTLLKVSLRFLEKHSFEIFLKLSLSDVCGQDRLKLADWFLHHGSPSLLEDPIPDYVSPPPSNPYDDPDNPPEEPYPATGVCGIKWSDTIDSASGHNKYWLK